MMAQLICSVCGLPITDDDYHDSHALDCPNFGLHNQDDPDDMVDCDCDLPCHAECCPECSNSMALERILRGRIKKDGATVEIDAYINAEGRLRIIVVGSPDEL